MLTLNQKISVRHLMAAIILIKASGVAFATLVFATYTPLVDSQNYLDGYYVGSDAFRTSVVQYLAILFGQLNSDYLTHFCFGVISAVGLIYYYQSGGRCWWLLLTLFLPSAFVWTSIAGKEALYYGASGLVLVLWTSYVVRSLRWYEVVMIAVSLCVCFSLRPHYAVALIWLYIATFSIKHLREKAAIFLLSLLSIMALLPFFLGVSETSIVQELLFRAYAGIDPMARASRFESLGIIPSSEPHHVGFKQFKEYIPLGALAGIIGPLPLEVLKRIEFLPFFIEGVLIFLSPLGIFFWARRISLFQDVLFKKNFWWCLVPAMLMLILIHAPFGILNPGSSIRWRTNFEQIFYLAPMLLACRFLYKDRK